MLLDCYKIHWASTSHLFFIWCCWLSCSFVHTVTPRAREGPAAEEVKEEPDDAAFHPTEAEAPMVQVLQDRGVPHDDAVQSLRRSGHDVHAALRHALETLTDRENSRREDMARYESEKEKEKAAAVQRQEDMTLTVLGDIAPRFQQVC